MVRGLFAASLKSARGISAAFVYGALPNARGATALFGANARGAHFQTPAVLPVRVRPFVSSSVREQVGSLLCRSGRSEVRRCNAGVPCVPPKPPTACDRPAAKPFSFQRRFVYGVGLRIICSHGWFYSVGRYIDRRVAAMAIAPPGPGAAAAVPRAACRRL